MTAVLQFVVTFVIVCAGGWWLVKSGALGELGSSFGEGRRAARSKSEPLKMSEVAAANPTGVLACPKCGGTQFKAQRKTSTKLAFGAASMLGQAHFVRCVTCGTRYRRG